MEGEIEIGQGKEGGMREHREREYRDNVCYCAVTVT